VGGTEAVLLYLVAYGAMTVGAFAVLCHVNSPQRPVETVDDLAGLGRDRPGMALLMTLFLFSLIGMPLTAGFIGKLWVFASALGFSSSPQDPNSVEQARLFQMLAVIGAVNAAIGGYYYLRIIGVMFLRDALKPVARPPAVPGLAAIWACAVVTVVVGVYPAPLVQAVRTAVRGPVATSEGVSVAPASNRPAEADVARAVAP
jgi:NADH-quinone oxidoreductase subunit N